MKDSTDETASELQRIEQETQVISKLSERLDNLEKKMKVLSDSRGDAPSSQTSADLQKIIMKITSLRELIDRIEIEIGQLDSRMDDIESLRFKHRSEK